MAPGVESLGYVRLESQDHHSHEAGSSQDQHDLGEVPASQEGDDQECHEEDQSRSEVTHQGKTAQTEYGKAHEYHQVFSLLQFIQRSCAHIDEDDLDQLGRLEGETADADPVGSTVFHRAEGQVDDQQQYADPHHDIDDPLGAIEISQEPAQPEE